MSRIVPILLLGILIGCTRSTEMKGVFSDLSIGVPEYQSIQSFTHPADAVKGDYFSLDFTQSSAQFHRFISKVSVAEGTVLSPAGASHVATASRVSLKYPWFLSIKAEAVNGAENTYHVHVEGRQPYD